MFWVVGKQKQYLFTSTEWEAGVLSQGQSYRTISTGYTQARNYSTYLFETQETLYSQVLKAIKTALLGGWKPGKAADQTLL